MTQSSAAHLRRSSPNLSLGTRIDLDDVVKRYRVGDTTVTALSDVTLHVDETAFVVVLGPSGSGKTTMLSPSRTGRIRQVSPRLSPNITPTIASAGDRTVGAGSRDV